MRLSGRQRVIHACYKNDGDLRFKVINAPSETCGVGFTALNFNQTGPIGPSGQRGASGVTGQIGPKGASGVSGATGQTGDPGVSGYEIVSEAPTRTVAQPNLLFWNEEVECPEGKVQLGGGAYAELFNSSDVSLGALDLMGECPQHR